MVTKTVVFTDFRAMLIRVWLALVLATFANGAFAQILPSSTSPITIGQRHVWRSDELGEDRVLNVYLPPAYTASDTTHYDVIYVLDGSLDEDFLHIVGLVQYFRFPWINGVPPSIVVGIANVDRERDFTFPSQMNNDRKRLPTSGGSARFMAFLEKEVQPFIAKQYRLSGRRTIIGQSLAGLMATEILYKKPYLFDTYIIVSPSLWWDGGSLLRYPATVLQAGFQQSTRIYVGVGKEGLATTDPPHVMEVDANVLADALKNSQNPHLKVYFDYLPEENHATVTHQAVNNAFRWLGGLKK